MGGRASPRAPAVAFVREAPEDDRFHDSVVSSGLRHPEAAHLTYIGLYALPAPRPDRRDRHGDGKRLRLERAIDLVNDVSTRTSSAGCRAISAIGHVRYSPPGHGRVERQPYLIECHRGPIAIGHDGDLVDAGLLRQELEAAGSIFQSTSTSRSSSTSTRAPSRRLEDDDRVEPVRGDGGLLASVPRRETPSSRRATLRASSRSCSGELDGATIVASETTALDLIGAEYLRVVERGELIVVDADGMRSSKPFPPEPAAHCVFEHVYFARPDSVVFGRTVLASRILLGRQLAREHPVAADVVVAVPDRGIGAALGYAQESGMPFEWGLIRNHYVGRTFIAPRQGPRSVGVKIKLNPVRAGARGQSAWC